MECIKSKTAPWKKIQNVYQNVCIFYYTCLPNLNDLYYCDYLILASSGIFSLTTCQSKLLFICDNFAGMVAVVDKTFSYFTIAQNERVVTQRLLMERHITGVESVVIGQQHTLNKNMVMEIHLRRKMAREEIKRSLTSLHKPILLHLRLRLGYQKLKTTLTNFLFSPFSISSSTSTLC